MFFYTFRYSVTYYANNVRQKTIMGTTFKKNIKKETSQRTDIIQILAHTTRGSKSKLLYFNYLKHLSGQS